MRRTSFWGAIVVLIVGCILTVIVTIPACNAIRVANLEEIEPLDLHLVVSDISVDIRARHVFATDFVRITHIESMEEPYVVGADANFELYLIGRDNVYWTPEWHFECEDVGVTELWVRLQDDGYDNTAAPVRAYLTLVDTWGECGDPMFYEGPNEEDTE